MSVTSTTLSPLRAGALQAGLFGRIRARMAARSAYRETVRELNRLDERELWDVGLARGDIHEAARRASENVVSPHAW